MKVSLFSPDVIAIFIGEAFLGKSSALHFPSQHTSANQAHLDNSYAPPDT